MHLTFVYGPMFAGKTTRLRQWVDPKAAEPLLTVPKRILVAKPATDTRASGLRSHDGWEWPAITVGSFEELGQLVEAEKPERVVVDEVHFLDAGGLPDFIRRFRNSDLQVIMAGLDRDYTGEFWPVARLLMVAADNLLRCLAPCAVCGELAEYTQRLQNGRPAPRGPRVLVGGTETYEPRCAACWQPPAE